MPILPSLNDRPCLGQVIVKARQFMETPEARAIASQLETVDDSITLIRSLEFREDLGHPLDGPRIQCDVSQRLRVPALDPNCVEQTAMFLGLAPLIDPDIQVTCATLQLDNGLHTFPVIIEDDRAYPVILDPVTAPPRNVMVAALYDIRNASPATRENVGPWFVEMAYNVCVENGMDDVYEHAMDALRNALLTGEPIEDPEDLETLLALTKPESELFGAMGRAAHDRVCRSVRNLSIALGNKRVSKVLTDLLSTTQPLAADAIKLALIAKFGPAAQIALQGVDLDTVDPRSQDRARSLQYRDMDEDPEAPDGTPERTRRKQKPSPAKRKRDMRRMALAFRQPTR